MFENFGKRVKGYGENIIQNTQNFSETVSLNNQIRQISKECDQIFTDIGRSFYEDNQNDVPDQYREAFEIIREKRNEIYALQEKMRQINGTWLCPNCGEENPSDAAFCPNCGTKRPVQEKQAEQPAEQQTAGLCPKCGAPYHFGDIFCGNCGFRLDAAAADAQKARMEEEKPDERQPEERQPEEGQPDEGQPEKGQPDERQTEEGQPEEQQPNERQPENAETEDTESLHSGTGNRENDQGGESGKII